ncbi:MAG TPA: beta-propeller fold lactonase family protein [Candidatus Sulfotelmatobacter sp.]
MLKKATALLFVGLSAATWISCGATSSHYLYTTLPGSNQIVVYREDPNSGTLTNLLNSPFTTGLAPESIQLHPSGKYLYVANSGEDTVSLFAIAADTGNLREVSRTPTGGLTPIFMAMDAKNSFLYAANVVSGNLSVFSFASDGTLSTVAGSPFSLNIVATGLALSPSGAFIFMGNELGQIDSFSLTGGVPTAVGQFLTSFKTIPTGLVVDKTGTYLYAANGNGGNSISEFTITSSGALQEFPGSPLGESGVSAPVALLIDPSGKFLYVANQGSNNSSTGNLAAYSIGSNGGLTILTLSPFSTVKQPTSLAADPNGKYVMVGGQTGSLEVFLLDTGNGTLGEVSTYSPGGFPSSMAVLP